MSSRAAATTEEPPARTPRARLVAEAERLGFEAIGFARADVALEDDFARYEAFVARGMHGEMQWLAALPEARRRVDGEHILPGAKTVICLARRYGRADDPEAPIARYARGRDYHNGMRKKLRKLAALARTLGGEGEAVQARPLCDEEPILERAWAARAGLGFVGKNGLLIVPGVGSFVLLGEVVTTLAIEPAATMTERCGSCTRCLDACPTEAFVAPWVLDPRRCIAYLTIEHRGAIAPELRPAIGEHLFGCDDCQTVCPFNATKRANGPLDPRFAPEPRWAESETPLAAMLALDDEGFVRLREGSPVGRATRAGLARNAAIVLGNRLNKKIQENSNDPSVVPALERASAEHDSPVVREAAAWALARLASR
ncbi:MAG: tRNA epoxyqueuosine(34) reductase QueG [Labilithrix sp.]|nr:tRNA epoxyqueuosine(34) reductase QueG [Labilithrix sp.]MCW5813944.1 tRNA epoxyqueuosine(34) reductase QueG [Labilithrix sp.]